MIKIQKVSIGLENGKWKKNYYFDTGRKVKDGDITYKIETTDATGCFENIYFEEKENAIDFIKETIQEEYIIE